QFAEGHPYGLHDAGSAISPGGVFATVQVEHPDLAREAADLGAAINNSGAIGGPGGRGTPLAGPHQAAIDTIGAHDVNRAARGTCRLKGKPLAVGGPAGRTVLPSGAEVARFAALGADNAHGASVARRGVDECN